MCLLTVADPFQNSLTSPSVDSAASVDLDLEQHSTRGTRIDRTGEAEVDRPGAAWHLSGRTTDGRRWCRVDRSGLLAR